MKTTPQEEWEEEYNDRFGFLKNIIESHCIVGAVRINWGEDIKSFIKSEKEKSRQEVLREVRDLKDNIMGIIVKNSEGVTENLNNRQAGYADRVYLNSVEQELKDLLSTLESKE